MAERTVQLVLHYDGARFAGWQRQPDERTVQGVVEETLSRLFDSATRATGAGRTDAGVHARGQAVSASMPEPWTAAKLRRALNALFPDDVWVAASYEMVPEFHARYSALSRQYSYRLGTDEAAHSPFRARWEWVVTRPLDREALDDAAAVVVGEHCFRAFAVRGTAPELSSRSSLNGTRSLSSRAARRPWPSSGRRVGERSGHRRAAQQNNSQTPDKIGPEPRHDQFVHLGATA